MIPTQLKKKEYKFNLVAAKEKIPLEKGWTDVTNYTYDDPKLLNHISRGGNYGVLGGYGDLIIIDADNPTLQKHLDKHLPSTLKVQTSKEGCCHNYFICKDMKNKIVLSDDEQGNHYGEIQTLGQFVVGANCIHPSGKKYTLIQDDQIAEIDIDILEKAIEPFKREVILVKKKIREAHERETDPIIAEIHRKVNVSDLMSDYHYDNITPDGLTMCKLGHSSKGGKCFHLSDDEKFWYCHHGGCLKGGDIFTFIMEHDNCDFLAAKEKLMAKAGIVHQNGTYTEDNKEFSLIDMISCKELLAMTDTREYLVKGLIPEKSVIMFYGQPGSYKSLVTTQVAISIANGTEFMDFETKKANVLICDMENGFIELRDRVKKLMAANGIENGDFPLYLTESSIGLDNPVYREALFKIVKEKDIKLIVLDTLNRFGNYDENSSSDINQMYTKVFKPLKEMGASVLFLHHTKKGTNDYRGSGDFLGNVDMAYCVAKENLKVMLRNEKNRFGKNGECLIGEITFKEDLIDIEMHEDQAVKENKGQLTKDFIIASLIQGDKFKDLLNRDILQLRPDISKKTIRRKVLELIEQGIITLKLGQYHLEYNPKKEAKK